MSRDTIEVAKVSPMAAANESHNWRTDICITVHRRGHPKIHRLLSGAIVDDFGRAGPDYVPVWAIDAIMPNVRVATAKEVSDYH